jgi:hypothetical protein
MSPSPSVKVMVTVSESPAARVSLVNDLNSIWGSMGYWGGPCTQLDIPAMATKKEKSNKNLIQNQLRLKPKIPFHL